MELSEFETKLEINEAAKSYLLESAKWGRFLAIVGFVMCGLMLVAGAFMGTIMSKVMGVGMESTNPGPMANFGYGFTFLYVIIAIVYFFPCYFLFNFSNKTKKAIQNSDSETLASALENHKSLFKFTGFLTMVILIIYGLVFILAALGGGMAALMR